jgi:nitrogen fixation/metabolism regulation signal transduction histidine kinase
MQINLAEERQDRAEICMENAREVLKEVSIASLLLSMICANIFALYVSRMISQPIEALTQVTEQATKKFNFSLQAAVTNDDEIRDKHDNKQHQARTLPIFLGFAQSFQVLDIYPLE